MEGLREGLTQLGYAEGQTITFMIEDTQGAVANLDSHLARLLQAAPDVIVTIGTAATVAAKQATTTVPIVFTFVGDPVRSGLVASYASSKNNLTGVSNYSGPLAGKRLEILQEIAPRITRVLLLVAPQEIVAEVSFQVLAEVAPKLGLEFLRQDVTSRADIEQALHALPKGAVDAICLVPSSLLVAHADLLIHKALDHHIPLAVHEDSLVQQGALVSYGASFQSLGRQAAKSVQKILHGTPPSALPIQTPDHMTLAINLATARAIGLTVPRNLLERAEIIIE